MPALARSMTAGQLKNAFCVRIKNNTNLMMLFHFETILLE
jgi:hypothetical protein